MEEQEKLTLTSEEQKKFDDFIKAEMAGTRPYPEIPAPSRCGSFTADMTFKQTYCEIFDALTALQDKMIVLAALHEREVRKAAETEETK